MRLCGGYKCLTMNFQISIHLFLEYIFFIERLEVIEKSLQERKIIFLDKVFVAVIVFPSKELKQKRSRQL